MGLLDSISSFLQWAFLHQLCWGTLGLGIPQRHASSDRLELGLAFDGGGGAHIIM